MKNAVILKNTVAMHTFGWVACASVQFWEFGTEMLLFYQLNGWGEFEQIIFYFLFFGGLPKSRALSVAYSPLSMVTPN